MPKLLCCFVLFILTAGVSTAAALPPISFVNRPVGVAATLAVALPGQAQGRAPTENSNYVAARPKVEAVSPAGMGLASASGLATTFLLPALSPKGLSDSSPSLQPSATPVPQGGVANLGLIGQPESLNPLTENNVALREITPLLFDTLLYVDPQTARLQPGLAEGWEYSPDGAEVTFHLPAGLKWSDGTRMTASVIAASLKATEHPALSAFSEIDALDSQTLTLTFARIDCAAVTTLAQLPLIPAAQILNDTPLGSGPFQIEEWSENKRVLTLTRNPHYHGPQPALDGVMVRFLASDEATIALSEGQFDLVGPVQSPITLSQLPNYSNLTYPAPQMLYLAINYAPRNEEPLSSEVREALLLALDRQTILAQALAEDGQLLAGSLLPGHWAAPDMLTWPDYNPNEARRRLAQTGLKDSDNDGWLDQKGQRVRLSIRLNGDNPLHQNLGWLISSYYRDLGLFARAEGVSADNIIDDLFTHDFSLALYSWPFLADPDQRMFWQASENSEGFGLNITSYNNSDLDELLEQAVAIPGCSSSERARIYNEAQKILAQERPVDFLLTPNRHLLVNSRLRGLQPGPFAPLTWNITAWHVLE